LIPQQIILEKLNELEKEKKFSQDLIQLIKIMLSPEEGQRPDIEKLYQLFFTKLDQDYNGQLEAKLNTSKTEESISSLYRKTKMVICS